MNTNCIQATCIKSNVLIITLSSWKCAEIGIADADIYIEFMHSESDQTASEMAITWLPLHAAEHESRVEHLSHADIIENFGSYSLLTERHQQEKLINWIAKLTRETDQSSS